MNDHNSDRMIDKYERKREIMDRLWAINEAIFTLGGSGDIKEAYEIIAEDEELLEYLDEIAKEKLRKEGDFPLDGDYQKRERVWKMLLDNGRLCDFIYDFRGNRL